MTQEAKSSENTFRSRALSATWENSEAGRGGAAPHALGPSARTRQDVQESGSQRGGLAACFRKSEGGKTEKMKQQALSYGSDSSPITERAPGTGTPLDMLQESGGGRQARQPPVVPVSCGSRLRTPCLFKVEGSRRLAQAHTQLHTNTQLRWHKHSEPVIWSQALDKMRAACRWRVYCNHRRELVIMFT